MWHLSNCLTVLVLFESEGGFMAKFRTDQIHNIAVFGHGSSGKTMLTESLLHMTGATTRLGRIEDGTTASDGAPKSNAEISR